MLKFFNGKVIAFILKEREDLLSWSIRFLARICAKFFKLHFFVKNVTKYAFFSPFSLLEF